MTGPGKENISQIPVESIFGADFETGFTLFGTPSGELSSCEVSLAVTDVFTPTNMAGLYLVQGVCRNSPIDGGIFEVQKQ